MVEQELIISATQSSFVFSYWELDLDVVEEGFYGYGYGTTNNFTIVGLHGKGPGTVNISTGVGPYSGTVSASIETGLGWEPGDTITVDDLDNLETYSGTVTSYDSSTGSILVAVASHPTSVSLATHEFEFSNPNPPSLDYFNVIGLAGPFSGYGYKEADSPSNITDFEPTYSYGWGYEFANFVFADSNDEIFVKARVLKDKSPEAGVRVVFHGSPGVLLNPASATTDANGYASTTVRVNKDIDINQLDGWGNRTESDDVASQVYGVTSQVFRNLTGSGRRTVTATIYQFPEIDDGKLVVATESVQRFFTEAVYNLDIGSYAFNDGEDI